MSKLIQIAEEIAPIKPRKKHRWRNNEYDKALESRHQAWLTHQSQKSDKSSLNLINATRKETT